MKKQVRKYVAQRIKEALISPLCLLLVIAIFYSVYSSVNFYSYKNESQRSSVTAISREASDAQNYLQSTVKSGNYSQEDFWRIYIYFNNLSSLCRTNGSIYGNAQSLFLEIGATFIDGGATSLCHTQGLFADGTITRQEAEYMERIADMLGEICNGISLNETSLHNIDVLNSNLRWAEVLLNDADSSPYLLIQMPA